MLEPFAERLARLGSGLAALGSLAWLLWPVANWQPEPEAMIAFGSAFLIWIAAELRSILRRPPHPHDVTFIRQLRSIISLDAIRYLDQHDFGATYDNERLDGFWKIDFDAQATGYGPHDKKLKRRFDDFREKVGNLSHLLAMNGGPIGASHRLSSIVPDRERATDEFSDETWKLVREANSMADEVVNRYEKLMNASRQRVPDAFG